MRKIVILAILAVMVWASYQIIVVGVTLGSYDIPTYDSIELKSENLSTALETLNTLNTTQYEARKTSLQSTIKNYKDKKEQYEALLPEMEAAAAEAAEEAASILPANVYDVDFLWTIIGNYATEEGVTIQFDVTKSTSKTSTSSDYIFCDLAFTISGDYITITDFIYDLEDDDRLNFEINNFVLEKGGDNLQATFNVKSIPVNNTNLTSTTTTTTTTTDTNTTTDATTNTTDTTSTTTDTNTTTTTNTVTQ